MPEGDAAVEALLPALKKLSPQAPTTLVSPSFDWSSKDQYDDLQLFVKSVNSWFTLQGIAEKTRQGAVEVENPIRLEYVLNFLGNHGRRRYERWQPTGDIPDVTKKKASAFLDHLQATMDHEISIRCRIYKLEETRIQPGETPDELVERLRTLADRCNLDNQREANSRGPQSHNSSSSSSNNSTPAETAHSSTLQDEPPAQRRMPNALHVVRQDTIGVNADRRKGSR